MSKENSHLRFPSGATAEQVGKDATKIQKERPELSWSEALDEAAQEHLASGGYKSGIEGAKRYDEFVEKRGDSPTSSIVLVANEPPPYLAVSEGCPTVGIMQISTLRNLKFLVIKAKFQKVQCVLSQAVIMSQLRY